MNENWKPVVGHAGYEVSDLGRVRSLYSGIVLRPALNRGYPAVSLRGRTRKVHSLVAEAFIGPMPTGQEVRHIDGDRLNPSATNLCYGTRAQNMADMVGHGTRAQGTRFKSAKLTEAAVREMRGAQGKDTFQALARKFGCSWQTIQKAATKKTWRHV